MIKQRVSTIFGFFFIRTFLAIAAFAFILVLILFPFFKNQLIQMVESQGQTFANTTVAATSSSLYLESYGEVIEYTSRVLRDTNDILFVVISKIDGQDIVITKDHWRATEGLFLEQKKRMQLKSKELYFADNPITHSSSFVYHQSFEIGAAPWGMMTIGLNDQQYKAIKKRYTLVVAIVSILLVITLSMIFYRSSKKIRLEMANLADTGEQLQLGNLAARASEDAIGEIGSLSKAINVMATNLQEQTKQTIQLAQIVKQTNDAFLLFNGSLTLVFVNDAVIEITGYSPEELSFFSMQELSSLLNLDLNKISKELEVLSANVQYSPTRDEAVCKKNGELIDVEIRLESILSQEESSQYYLMVLSNITTRKHLENELHQLAFYDKLTDLPNRRLFMDRLRHAIQDAAHNGKIFAVFFMDLDNFKFINDTLGHDAGDELLIQVSKRLKSSIRANDLVTRLGGDEFTILIADIEPNKEAYLEKLAEKIISQLAAEPFLINDRSLSMSTSLGVATYPNHGLDGDTLLRNADIAMYSAKKSGKNQYAIFSDEMNATLQYRIAMENELKEAVVTAECFDYYYQPIVDINSNRLVGAEALVRWHHPANGFISPIEFIPIAESSDLIVKLGGHLLNLAFKKAKEWSCLDQQLYLSINISVRQFEKATFLQSLERALKKYDLSADYIQLEFTESIMLESTSETIAKFNALKDMGFKIAIDDFGTGYSSLAYIHKLPIDVIKIDRSFISGVASNKKINSIVAAISKLSSSLDIQTVAEGIESIDDAEALKKIDCRFGQGYLFDRPLPVEEFEQKYLSAYLRSKNENPASRTEIIY